MAKVLVLEDSPGLQRVILTKLKQEGYDVFGADNVMDAVRIVESDSDFTLFWVNHSLIGQSTGLDFLKKIRGNDDYKDTPAILVSSVESSSELDQYKKVGVSKHYQKSKYTVSEIIAEIRRII
jgi:CheY-like chemotaxis protein